MKSALPPGPLICQLYSLTFCFPPTSSPSASLVQVCLDFVSRNLATVMTSDGYRHMTASCPQLQAEILQTIATTGGNGGGGGEGRGGGGGGGGRDHRAHGAVRPRDHLALVEDGNPRRVRARLD